MCPVAKLRALIYGDFCLQRQNERKQKRLPWQETVFTIADKVGRLSPQGGDLVQTSLIRLLPPHLSRIIEIHGWHGAFGCVRIILVVGFEMGPSGREMAFRKLLVWDQCRDI